MSFKSKKVSFKSFKFIFFALYFFAGELWTLRLSLVYKLDMERLPPPLQSPYGAR